MRTIGLLLLAVLAWPLSSSRWDCPKVRTRPAEMPEIELCAAVGRPVWLVEFTSETCAPCQSMKPVLGQLVAAGYRVKTVRIEEYPNIAARYRVTAVPTFIVVDRAGRELARLEGARPGDELAAAYNASALKPDPDPEPAEEPFDPPAPETTGSPRPWETACRLAVDLGGGRRTLGSGTIVGGDPEAAFVLTCSHLFGNGTRDEKGRNTGFLPWDQVNAGLTVEVFGAELGGPGNRTLRPVSKHRGKVLEAKLHEDVAIVEFSPGRELVAAPIIGANWEPTPGEPVVTVGCPDGADATAWSTRIASGLKRDGDWTGFDAKVNPRQGRSGGGLFTRSDLLAGICNFSRNDSPRGMYADARQGRLILTAHGIEETQIGFRRRTAPNSGSPRPEPELKPEDRRRPILGPNRPRDEPPKAPEKAPEIAPKKVEPIPEAIVKGEIAYAETVFYRWLASAALSFVALAVIAFIQKHAN